MDILRCARFARATFQLQAGRSSLSYTPHVSEKTKLVLITLLLNPFAVLL
jgi:hypothetical protein